MHGPINKKYLDIYVLPLYSYFFTQLPLLYLHTFSNAKVLPQVRHDKTVPIDGGAATYLCFALIYHANWCPLTCSFSLGKRRNPDDAKSVLYGRVIQDDESKASNLYSCSNT